MIQFLHFIKDLFLSFYLLLVIITIINAFNKKSLFHTVIKDKAIKVKSIRMIAFLILYFISIPVCIIYAFFVNVYKLLDDEE